MSEEGQSIGTARIDVVVNTDRMDAAVNSAKTRISSMSAQAQTDYAALSAAQKRATDSALTQADAIGKSREEMTLYKASLKGLPVSILDELKVKLVAAQAAANEAALSINSVGSGLSKSTLSDAGLYKVNQSLLAYKEQATSIQVASEAEANASLKRASFSDANLFRINQTISKYKEQTAAIQAAAEIDASAMLDKASLSDASLLKINQSLSAYKLQSAAEAELAAQTATDDAARIEKETRWQAFLNESAAEKIAVNEAVAASNAALEATYGADAATFNAAVLRKNAALTELNASLASGIPDIAALTGANERLDAAIAAGALSAYEQEAYITTLNTAEERLTGIKLGETIATEANTVATNANTVAKGMNSRVAYSVSALISDAATGQLGRSKREIAAIANETGLLSKIFTPTGIAIAAVVGTIGLLGVAAYKAAENESELEKSITRSGDAAGLDAEQIKNLAAQYSTYYTSTKDVVSIQEQLMATGAVTVSTFKVATQAAVTFGEATGESQKQVIQTFDELSKNPLQTLDKINAVYGSITPKIRDHVQALLDEGDKLDAVAAAYQAIIDTMSHTADMEHAQEGLVDRLVARWKSGASEIGDAYAKLVNGLSLTEQFQLARSTYELHLQSTQRNSPLDRLGGQVFSNSELQAEHDKVQAIADQIKKVRDAAALGGQTTQDNKAGNAADSYYDSHFAKLDKIKQKQKEINDLTATYEQMWEHTSSSNARLNGVQRVLDENGKASFVGGNYESDLAAINAKFKDKKTSSQAGSKSDPLMSLQVLTNSSITQNLSGATQSDPEAALLKQQVAQLNAITKAAGEAITKHADLAKVQALVATATQNVNAHFAAEDTQLKQKNIDAVARYKASLDDMLATRKQQIELQAQSLGQSALETQHQEQLLALQDDYNKKRASLVRQEQNTTSALNKAGYTQQISDLDAYEKEAVKAVQDGWKTKAAAQANGIGGMNRAIGDFINNENDLNKESYTFTQNFINGFGGAFTSFITGTENAKKSFGSFIDSMYQQSVAFLANQAIKALFQSFAPQSEGGTGGGFSSLLGNFAGDLGFGGGGSGSGAATSTSSGLLGGSTIGDAASFNFAQVSGGYADGGTVRPNSLYEVNERGPELYSQGGKTYLMGGTKQGQVNPIKSGGGSVVVNQNITVSGLVNRQTQDQLLQKTAQKQRVAQSRNS